MTGYENSPDYGGRAYPLWLYVLVAVLIITITLWGSGAFARTRHERPTVIGIASVIDGDSIEIHGGRYRLWGIDAPESGQFCGQERMGQKSANALSDIIAGRTLHCEDRGSGGWGRRVVYCTAGGEDIQARMVRDGFAFAFSKYSHDYEASQSEAKNANLGVWAAQCQAPWEWRAEHRHQKG